MIRNSKIALVYLAALLPLCCIALAWALSSWPLERADSATVIFGAMVVCAATRLKIQLPKSNGHLALSDAIILFSILCFGGEYAVLVCAAAALVTAALQFGKRPLIQLLTNICIRVITVFVTAIMILSIFGRSECRADKTRQLDVCTGNSRSGLDAADIGRLACFSADGDHR